MVKEYPKGGLQGEQAAGRVSFSGTTGSGPILLCVVQVRCHACPKGCNSCWVNVCEMLIRHECCGVGAPGSGGGTPCATSLNEMEALLS